MNHITLPSQSDEPMEGNVPQPGQFCYPIGRKALFCGFAFTALCFFVYFVTLFPTVTPGTNGSFITQAFLLETGPSPGFSPYIIAGKLFTLLPVKSAAWRVNLMSACFNTLSLLLLYLILVSATGRIAPALSGCGALAFSSAFWLSSVTAHPAAVLNFLTLLTLYCACRWKACEISGQDGKALLWLYLLAFIMGLSLTVSLLPLCLAPGVLYFVFAAKENRDRRRLITFTGFLLLGFTPSLAVFLSPCLRMLFLTDFPAAMAVFRDLLLYRDWGAIPFITDGSLSHWGPSLLERQCLLSGSLILHSLTAVTVLISIIGALWLYEKNRDFGIALLPGLILSCPLWLFFFRTPPSEEGIALASYHICIPLIILALFAGYGAAFLIASLEAGGPSGRHRLIFPGFCSAAVIALCVVPPCIGSHSNIVPSISDAACEYGRNVLEGIENDAVLVAADDTTSSVVQYLQLVELKRADVTVLPVYPPSWRSLRLVQERPWILTGRRGVNEIKNSVSEGYRGFSDSRLYFTALIKNIPARCSLYGDITLVRQNPDLLSCGCPHGLAFRIVRGSQRSSLFSEFSSRNQSVWNSITVSSVERVRNSETAEAKEIVRLYAEALMLAGIYYAIYGDYDAAELWLAKSVSAMSSFKPAQEHLQRVRDIRKKRIEGR
ncbi:MAG: protein O-mannosyl-transferase family [Candidatus Xenobiia bacterium LiM19]